MKKKILIFLAVFVLIFAASCAKDEPGTEPKGDTDKAETSTGAVEQTGNKNENGILTIDPNDYYNCVVFELPKEDFRDAAVNHMRAQSSIEWVCSKDFEVSEKWEYWGISLQWKEGVKYMGIPYSDTKVSLEEFKTYMVDGTFTYGSNKWKEVPGNGCMSAVFNAIQQFDPSVAGHSNQLMPSFDTFEAEICGEYTVPAGVQTTNEIITANEITDIYEAFANLKKGDLVITTDYIKRTSHIRMLVEDPTVVRNSAGAINRTRSYVKTIEQTNAFDKQRTDGVKTTWYVDHIYTFNALIEQNYIPITLEIYNKDKSECEIPYLYLDKEITPELLAKGTSTSMIKSNFPIRFMKIELLDKNGNSVKNVVVHDLHDTRSITLRNHMLGLFTDLENGDYTFVLTSGIAIGNAEFARVDFSYNK